MKFYDEKKMKDVRRTLEREMLKWPGVAGKEMMGCLCYVRGTKFFVFLVTDGIVITKLTKEERAEISGRMESKPFAMAGRIASSWIQLPVKTPASLRPLMPYIRRSYEAASG